MSITGISKTRVLIVDNHELVRSFLTLSLGRYEDIEIVGAATDGEEAVSLAQELKPDVILMDLQMPVMDGLTASGHIKVASPTIQIIAYTSLDDPQLEVMAQTVPIDQFCYKDTKTEVLVDMIRQCKAAGQSDIS